MQYVVLIYESEAERAKMTPAELQTDFQGYFAFNAAARAEGALLGGEPLRDTSTATSLRVRNQGGEVLTQFDMPGVGRMAIAKDSTGGVFGLITPSEA
ncbi:MAG: hypothetical protein R3F61_13010 [Myxococcota bacterium]